MNTDNVYRMSDPPTGPQPEPEADTGGFWTSKTGLVTIAFLLIAAFFLLCKPKTLAVSGRFLAHFFRWLIGRGDHAGRG